MRVGGSAGTTTIADLRAELAAKDAAISAQSAALIATRGDLRKANERIEALAAMVRMFQRKLFGHATERAVESTCADQQAIDETWLGDARHETPPPDAATTNGDERAAGRTPSPRGIAARCPRLQIRDQDQQLPPEIAEQVASGAITVERTGAYHDELVTGRESAFIRRTFVLRVLRRDGTPSMLVPPTPRIRPGGELADETAADLVISKFLDAIPIHRQLAAWARRGVDVPRQTAGEHVASWCDLFAPIADAIRSQVLRAAVVNADESWFRVQDANLKRRCRIVNVWTLAGDGQAAYRYTEDRRHIRAHEVVGTDFAGFLVRDEWQGWMKLGKPTHVGCNAHARRPFALVQEDDELARLMVALFGELYAVEKSATASGLLGEALWSRRRELRQATSRAIWDRIADHARRVAAERPPTSELAKGARYILNHRSPLTLFLDHGQLPLDNNHAENCLRITALIRKNSLFFGSDDGGRRAVVALSVLHSCRLQKIEPHAYLAHVTPILLGRHPGERIDHDTLTPRALAPFLTVGST